MCTSFSHGHTINTREHVLQRLSEHFRAALVSSEGLAAEQGPRELVTLVPSGLFAEPIRLCTSPAGLLQRVKVSVPFVFSISY